MAKHSRFGASSSHRWLACPASIKEEANMPSHSSVFAQEGTCAHEVADQCLKNDKAAAEFIGETIEGIVVTEEMAGYVQEYIDYIEDIRAQYSDTILLHEQRVDYSNVAPDGFGTLDAAIIVPSKCLVHIFDLKYGKGIRVEATNNTQAMFYALGLLNEYSWLYDLDLWHIHICQPRLRNFSEWDTTANNLHAWKRQFVIPMVNDALSDKPTYNPSDETCKWCKAKANCPALHEYIKKNVTDTFDNLTGEISEVTDEDKRRLLDNKELYMSLLTAVDDEVYSRISAGGEFSGYKLILGRSTTKWLDTAEDALAKKYGEDIYNKKMIGITEARKLLTKAELDQYTAKLTGNPKLVKDSVKGEPLILSFFDKLP